MLFMQFTIGNNRYLLEARDVIEIAPFACLKQIPKAPPYVAGLLNYRGASVPVIDIACLMNDQPSEPKLSTRIALVKHENSKGETSCIGLLIEHLTETVRFDESDFSDSGVNLKDNPYLGKVIIDQNSIVQLVDFRKIIPEEVHEILLP